MNYLAKVALAGLAGAGVSYIYNQASGGKTVDPQACVLKDTKTVPGMINYFNGCNFSLATYACKKILADDAVEIFSASNRRNCTEKTVEPNGIILFGNLYDKSASFLWNATTLSEVRIYACKSPKVPQNINGSSYSCN